MTTIFSTLTKQVPNTLEHADRWRERAACANGFDPEDWFPVGEGLAAQQQTDDAKAVCRSCPVMEICLRWAMENGQQTGVWGGLSEQERRRLHRRKIRAARAPDGDQQPARFSRPRTDQPRTPASVYAENTEPLPGGHTAWVTCQATAIGDQKYTPMQLAWVMAYGKRPLGRLAAACGHRGCVTPGHLKDHGADKCGSRPGYQRHLRRGEVPCAPCRQANTDDDRRLRNTGTTKPKPKQAAKEPRLPAGVARCGTTDGYKAHKRWQEQPCQSCRDAHATHTEQLRAVERAAADAPSLSTCGTRSGYDIHTARGEAPCRPCTDARAHTEWLLREGGTTKQITERSAA